MKKSVALLSVLIFTLFLTGVVLYILSRPLTSTVTVAEDNLIIQSFYENMKKTDINSSEALRELLIKYPPLTIDDFELQFSVELLSSKFNLNSYLLNSRINPFVERVLDMLLEKYNVKDKILFKNILLDSLDNDKIPRDTQSEIENPLFKEGNLSKKGFEYILQYYVELTDDKSVLSIPWERYFYFLNSDYKVVCEFLSDDVKELFEINDCNSSKKYIIPFKEINNTVIKAGFEYKLQNQPSKIDIIYNLKKKKVIKIEKHPLY